MNKPLRRGGPDLADQLADLLARVKNLLSDSINARAWQDMPSNNPEGVGRFQQEFSAVLSILDQSVSNPALHDVFADLNARLAKTYSAKDAQFVENGTSGGNVRLGVALARALSSEGRRVVAIDRLAHASVIGAAALADLDPVFMHRHYSGDHDVTVPLSAAEVDDTLTRTGARAAWITSPTYDGFCPDLAAIAEVCRLHDAYLLVDAAWGALHGFSDCGPFPPSATACGADASVVSLHKKGIGLSQASAAFFNDPVLARNFRQVGDMGLATTSPLYLLPASVQVGLDALELPFGALAWREAAAAADEFRGLVQGYCGCRVIQANQLGTDVFGDPCHVLVNIRDTGADGFQIREALSLSGRDLEMVTRDTVLLLFGPEHTDSAPAIGHAFKRAIDLANKDLANKYPRGENLVMPALKPLRPMTPREALMAPSSPLLLADAVGRIAAQTIGAFPPGQAVICPGEQITRDVADYLFVVERAGGRIKGVAGSLAITPIEVIAL